jgi:glycosyltransferase involved in cell wall biosynthesis
MSNVAVLIATNDRMELLTERSLPSVMQQTHTPPVVVVVNDGPRLTRNDRIRLCSIGASTGVEVVVMPNARTPGAGGAWNTGLEWLSGRRTGGFVAILDDDDAWDPEHIEANLSASRDADITVSGLRMHLHGRVMDRPLIEHLEPRSFLVGNPGWQGSNTFVTLDLLLRVGGFREGLQSVNDRDLAFRLLSHPAARWRLVPRWTATWHADTPGNLSKPRSPQKLQGLRAFWALYGREMSSTEARIFFDRALRLFGFEEGGISGSPVASCPPLGFPGGSPDA